MEGSHPDNPYPPAGIGTHHTVRVKRNEYLRMADLAAPLSDRPNDVLRMLLDFFDAHCDSEDYAERRMILECFVASN